MEKSGKKKGLILAVSVILIIAVFGVIAVTITSTTKKTAQMEADAQIQKKEGTGTSSADKAAAEELIGKSMSREEVQEALGEWEDFEMSSEGCERGVYAGRFDYGDFTIFSRTYDKGETFQIVSIN